MTTGFDQFDDFDAEVSNTPHLTFTGQVAITWKSLQHAPSYAVKLVASAVTVCTDTGNGLAVTIVNAFFRLPEFLSETIAS